MIDLTTQTTRELFALHRGTLVELRARGVVRTEHAPQGDYAEWLVVRAFGGVLEANSRQSWDVTTPTGERIQVKARVLSTKNKSRQLSAFRSFDFDAVVVVLFSEIDLGVVRAVKMPSAVVKAQGAWRQHTNSYTVHANAALLDHTEAVDVSELLRQASDRREKFDD